MEFTRSNKGNVLVIADDLGLTKSVNDGIIFLLKEGKISGASLMSNGEAFDDAILKIANLEARLPSIGVHLVLVEEKSLTGIKLPKNHKTFFIKYVLGLIKLGDVKKELRAQINKCVRAGIKPSFINSHQHLHLLPGIADMVIKLAKEFNITYIRIVHEPISLSDDKLLRQLQLVFLNFLSWLVKIKITKNGLICNDFFVGFINAGNLGFDEINLSKKLQSKYPDKFIELGCHPGFESPALVQKYRHWRYHWRQEVEILKKLL